MLFFNHMTSLNPHIPESITIIPSFSKISEKTFLSYIKRSKRSSSKNFPK